MSRTQKTYNFRIFTLVLCVLSLLPVSGAYAFRTTNERGILVEPVETVLNEDKCSAVGGTGVRILGQYSSLQNPDDDRWAIRVLEGECKGYEAGVNGDMLRDREILSPEE